MDNTFGHFSTSTSFSLISPSFPLELRVNIRGSIITSELLILTSGRRSLAKLAAFVCELHVFQIELTRAYGLNEWREDVRQLLLRAGLHNREGVFLFSDTQVSLLRLWVRS